MNPQTPVVEGLGTSLYSQAGHWALRIVGGFICVGALGLSVNVTQDIIDRGPTPESLLAYGLWVAFAIGSCASFYRTKRVYASSAGLVVRAFRSPVTLIPWNKVEAVTASFNPVLRSVTIHLVGEPRIHFCSHQRTRSVLARYIPESRIHF